MHLPFSFFFNNCSDFINQAIICLVVTLLVYCLVHPHMHLPFSFSFNNCSDFINQAIICLVVTLLVSQSVNTKLILSEICDGNYYNLGIKKIFK